MGELRRTRRHLALARRSGCCGAAGGFAYRGRTGSTAACCGAAVGGGAYGSPIPIPVEVVTESFSSQKNILVSNRKDGKSWNPQEQWQ
ncbi:unnamed protein product [Urochloa humidicola]